MRDSPKFDRLQTRHLESTLHEVSSARRFSSMRWRVSASLSKKLIVTVIVLLIAAEALSGWVLWAVGRELNAVRVAFSQATADSGDDSIDNAESHLAKAKRELNSFKTDVARYIPITRQNIDALAATIDALLPVVHSGEDVIGAIDSMEGKPIIERGEVDTGPLRAVAAPLADQIAVFDSFRAELDRQRSGWMLPAVWNGLEELEAQLEDFRSRAVSALDALELMDSLLGRPSARTYLVVLLNNAELRGSGGLPSSVGTLSVHDERVSLGRFYYTGDLKDQPPYQSVPAPTDFKRRWGRYGAATTLWSNLTMSPDVPDVALVAARLFRLKTGRDVNGVFFADPRGISALMSPGATVRVQGTPRVLTRSEIPDYIYQDAYEELGGFSRRRRQAILRLGERAFRAVFRDGVVAGRDTLLRIGKAVGGGHLRFVPFSPSERSVMTRIGATGDFAAPRIDSVLVTAQATAAHKLDYYIDREISHSCELGAGEGDCSTTVTISNRTPSGLSKFVAPGSPYGLLKTYLEVYIPSTAVPTGVRLDGRHSEFIRGEQDGHTSIGFDLELPRGESLTASVDYRLDIDNEYSLVIRPQPLAHDASIDVALDIPGHWHTYGVGRVSGSDVRFTGLLDQTLRWNARRRARTGISAAWEAFWAFWNEPLF